MTFEGVHKRATEILDSKKGKLVVATFLSPEPHGYVGTTEQTPSTCLALAAQIKRSQDLAFLYISPNGASLHYWSKGGKSQRSEVLQGLDPLTPDPSGTEIVHVQESSGWIGGTKELSTVVWAVNEGGLPLEAAVDYSHRIVRSLGLTQAQVHIRKDPWYWPHGCSPFLIPKMWKMVPPNAEDVSLDTIICNVSTDEKGSCELITSVIRK